MTTRLRSCLASVLALSLVSIAGAALAQGGALAQGPAAGGPPANVPRWVVACQADVDKHCKAEQAKGGVPECLKAHEKDLGEACQDAFIRPFKVAELCREDIEKHCKEAQKAGRLGVCMKEKKDVLSEKCRSAISKGSKEYAAAKKEESAKAEAPPAADPAPTAKDAKKKGKKGKKPVAE